MQSQGYLCRDLLQAIQNFPGKRTHLLTDTHGAAVDYAFIVAVDAADISDQRPQQRILFLQQLDDVFKLFTLIFMDLADHIFREQSITALLNLIIQGDKFHRAAGKSQLANY